MGNARDARRCPGAARNNGVNRNTVRADMMDVITERRGVLGDCERVDVSDVRHGLYWYVDGDAIVVFVDES